MVGTVALVMLIQGNDVDGAFGALCELRLVLLYGQPGQILGQRRNERPAHSSMAPDHLKYCKPALVAHHRVGAITNFEGSGTLELPLRETQAQLIVVPSTQHAVAPTPHQREKIAETATQRCSHIAPGSVALHRPLLGLLRRCGRGI